MYQFTQHLEYHGSSKLFYKKTDHGITWMEHECYPGMKPNLIGELPYEQGTQIFIDGVLWADPTHATHRW